MEQTRFIIGSYNQCFTLLISSQITAGKIILAAKCYCFFLGVWKHETVEDQIKIIQIVFFNSLFELTSSV